MQARLCAGFFSVFFASPATVSGKVFWPTDFKTICALIRSTIRVVFARTLSLGVLLQFAFVIGGD
jgi:hypothetical protein